MFPIALGVVLDVPAVADLESPKNVSFGKSPNRVWIKGYWVASQYLSTMVSSICRPRFMFVGEEPVPLHGQLKSISVGEIQRRC